MSRFKRRNAMTLVEVILAMVILAIIVIVSINALTGGFVNIISMGNKTRAVSEAQSVLDYVESSGHLTYAELSAEFARIKNVVPKADLETSPYDAAKPLYYSLEDVTIGSIAMKRITVLAYYKNGEQYIKVSTMVSP